MDEQFHQKMVCIMQAVQQSAACHQKYMITVVKLYEKIDLETFVKEFLRMLKILFAQNLDPNMYVKRSITFCSQCCAEITRKTSDDEINPHPFLSRIIEETLKFTDLHNVFARYHSCEFVRSTLNHIGDGVQLDNDVCDRIQQAMLLRLEDPKIQIRLQALSTLIRLQDPLNPKCPVIMAYLTCLSDSSAIIRRETIKVIAPNNQSLPKIQERVLDVDPSVRAATFNKCADIGPYVFKIIERHTLLNIGFKDKHKNVEQAFYHNFIPKWFLAYKENYIKVLESLKLSSDEKDLEALAYIGKKLLHVLFKSHPMEDIIEILPIKDQLVPIESFTSEILLLWNAFVTFLRSTDEIENYLDTVLPDLTPFSKYIESYMKERCQETMDEWTLMEYQFNLLNLFEIVADYDFSDEVGRRSIHELAITTLTKNTKVLNNKLIEQLVQILLKCSLNINYFTTEICQVISEIKEPLIEEEVRNPKNDHEQKLLITKLKVKLYQLQHDLDAAITKRHFAKAKQINNERTEIENELKTLTTEATVAIQHVRVTRDDDQTHMLCLDILIATLKLAEVKTITVSIETCKKEFLIPLVTCTNPEIHWRVLNVFSLLSIIDEATAKEWAKFICLPVATYRHLANFNVKALTTSVKAISDLLWLYGTEIVGIEEKNVNCNVTKRTLYSQDEYPNMLSPIEDAMTLSSLFEILLGFIDEEPDELKVTAIQAIAPLMLKFPLSPNVISRIVLKWCSPAIGKEDKNLQFLIGNLIEKYIGTVKNGKTVMKDAIMPTLLSIIDAPKTSPLVDIDLDNLTKFFAAIISLNHMEDIRIAALELLMKISENVQDKVVPHLIKILSHLELTFNDSPINEELLHHSQSILNQLQIKNTKKNLEKFISKIKQNIEKNKSSSDKSNNVSNENKEEHHDTSTDSEQNEPEECKEIQKEIQDEILTPTTNLPKRVRNLSLDCSKNPIPIAESTTYGLRSASKQTRPTITEQVKRKKIGKNQFPRVVLEKMLTPITQNSVENENSSDSFTIETPSSNGSRHSVAVVVTETSDTDGTSSSKSRSKRRRKRRR